MKLTSYIKLFKVACSFCALGSEGATPAAVKAASRLGSVQIAFGVVHTPEPTAGYTQHPWSLVPSGCVDVAPMRWRSTSSRTPLRAAARAPPPGCRSTAVPSPRGALRILSA